MSGAKKTFGRGDLENELESKGIDSGTERRRWRLSASQELPEVFITACSRSGFIFVVRAVWIELALALNHRVYDAYQVPLPARS